MCRSGRYNDAANKVGTGLGLLSWDGTRLVTACGAHKRLQAERLPPEVWCLAGRAKCPRGCETKPICPLESVDGRPGFPLRIRLPDLRSRPGPAVHSVHARDPQGIKGNAIRPFRVDPAGGRGCADGSDLCETSTQSDPVGAHGVSKG